MGDNSGTSRTCRPLSRPHTRGVSVIDGYLAELGRALHGPRRAKADLLEEARGGLLDAARAYEDGGLDGFSAQRRAVAEFGSVARLAPEYQIELGYAQTQRTALLICLVLAPQAFVWHFASHAFASTHSDQPGAAFALLNPLMSWLGAAGLFGSLLAALACGLGVRYVGMRRRLTAATGVFALAAAGVFAIGGVLMTLLGPTPALSLAGLPWVAAVLVLPMALVARSGKRCLNAAG